MIVAAGVCVMFGMLWARIVGVILAGFSVVANFMFISFYPLWSVLVIAADMFIVWALLCRGRYQPA